MSKTGFGSALEAEQAFYAAYQSADSTAMAQVWDSADDIECIHPLGKRLTGAAVQRGWRDIFAHAEPIAFHISERRSFIQGELTVHLVLQNILFQDHKAEPLVVFATNVFRRSASGWRMVLHHASPAPITGSNKQTALH